MKGRLSERKRSVMMGMDTLAHRHAEGLHAMGAKKKPESKVKLETVT